jgi:hypothetical protein
MRKKAFIIFMIILAIIAGWVSVEIVTKFVSFFNF